MGIRLYVTLISYDNSSVHFLFIKLTVLRTVIIICCLTYVTCAVKLIVVVRILNGKDECYVVVVSRIRLNDIDEGYT